MTPLPRRTTRPRRRAASGPSSTTRATVWARAGGRCELCTASLAGPRGFSVHHRLPRRMGGSTRPELNTPANLVILCGSGTTGCHGWVEGHRERAHADGLLLHAGEDPTRVPVRLAALAGWARPVWLLVDGTYSETPPEGTAR